MGMAMNAPRERKMLLAECRWYRMLQKTDPFRVAHLHRWCSGITAAILLNH